MSNIGVEEQPKAKNKHADNLIDKYKDKTGKKKKVTPDKTEKKYDGKLRIDENGKIEIPEYFRKPDSPVVIKTRRETAKIRKNRRQLWITENHELGLSDVLIYFAQNKEATKKLYELQNAVVTE